MYHAINIENKAEFKYSIYATKNFTQSNYPCIAEISSRKKNPHTCHKGCHSLAAIINTGQKLQGIPLEYIVCRPHFPHPYLSPSFFLLLSENEQDIELQ